jgi:hypothetical protein
LEKETEKPTGNINMGEVEQSGRDVATSDIAVKIAPASSTMACCRLELLFSIVSPK